MLVSGKGPTFSRFLFTTFPTLSISADPPPRRNAFSRALLEKIIIYFSKNSSQFMGPDKPILEKLIPNSKGPKCDGTLAGLLGPKFIYNVLTASCLLRY